MHLHPVNLKKKGTLIDLKKKDKFVQDTVTVLRLVYNNSTYTKLQGVPVVAGHVAWVDSRVVRALYTTRPTVAAVQDAVAVSVRQQFTAVTQRRTVAVPQVRFRTVQELVAQLEVKVVSYTLKQCSIKTFLL